MPLSHAAANSRRRAGFLELKFTTRIALVFGALGLLALLVSMAYAYRTAEQSLQQEIDSALQQRHRAVENLIEIRLGLLDVYLQSAAANRIFTSVVDTQEEESPLDVLVEDMAFMFQDSALGANLDVFFIVDNENELVFDAGLPLYDIEPLFAAMRAPFIYSNRWSVVSTDNLTVLIKSVPLFDPATIQLRGYMFIGLAVGQNRAFLSEIADRADLDILKLGYEGQVLLRHAGVNFVSELDRQPQMGEVDISNNVYLLREAMSLPGGINNIWTEVGISADRFPSLTESYQQTFFLLSGGFIVLLLIAAWLIHLSHAQNVGRLMKYIQDIQSGTRGAVYVHGGIKEYNQVGSAMQEMVQDLNVAATVFESTEGMIVTDQNRIILRANEAFSEITGYSTEEAIGQPLDLIKSDRHETTFFSDIDAALDANDSWQGEVWNRRKNGDDYLQWTSITAVRTDDDDTVINYVVTLIDATQRKAAEMKITQLAFYDQLTGLPNRQLLMDRLDQAIAASVRHRKSGAILYIDLDDFKTLNDTRGHDVGDLLLKQVANRLLNCVRKSDTVARIGGDEFIILLEDLDIDLDIASQQVEVLAETILETLPAPYYIGGIEQFSTLSIGITLFQGEQDTFDELLKQADLAMYQAKAAGRNTRRFFNPSMQARVLEHAEVANDIRKGMHNHEFVLYFQPQMGQSRQLIGAEALLRWNHPTRGLVAPGGFISVAEETGLILPLGQWVLESACAVLAQWAQSPKTAELSLAINISARQLVQVDFVDQVISALHHSGANAQRLKLELTESMLLNDVEDTIQKMHQLRVHGVTFSLDDFGTGYSSLSYLRQLPLDQLKIDQSFVQDLAEQANHTTIAQTIVTLAKGLDISVIAEGVETEAQCIALTNYGCEAYQGYLFGRPMPLEELVAMAAQ
ncbi:EAL domain-containing protein [Salinispirillum marinum]|uniref:EAL domain-containing protein n=2 Tax=Saccharospirillaceae TaxID=255527 RepID=A0ABV8BGU8_9GAMM